jgi:2,4-dienoyl-CoA reductase-like NADH-dependent reductase (Old Yellow Enzyme family)
MSCLFQPIAIDGVEMRNRFLRSATWDRTGTDDGAVTDASVRIIEDLARGGVGLIVTGYAFVSEQGKAAVRQLGISHDRHVKGLSRLARAAHEHGARIAVQVAHGGANLGLLGRAGRVALAPSRIEGHPQSHREATSDEIQQIVHDFAAAAARGREAGFDAVQLHGAHGYLLSQFLSPRTNHRTDEWGGSPERRRRFLVEVVRAVRHAVGEGYPVWMKMGLRDYSDDGLELDEGLQALRALIADGLSAVEVSSGFGARSARTARPGDEEDPYFREEGAAAKGAVDVPVMLVGGIRSLGMAEDILNSWHADMISICRPLIREPHLIARWQRGDTAPSKCISCNKCLAAGVKGEPLRCEEERLLREEAAAR